MCAPLLLLRASVEQHQLPGNDPYVGSNAFCRWQMLCELSDQLLCTNPAAQRILVTRLFGIV
jgi:hypothetical protein